MPPNRPTNEPGSLIKIEATLSAPAEESMLANGSREAPGGSTSRLTPAVRRESPAQGLLRLHLVGERGTGAVAARGRFGRGQELGQVRVLELNPRGEPVVQRGLLRRLG